MKLVVWAAAAFLLAPLAVVVLCSVNRAEASPQMTGVTLHWYEKALRTPGFREGLVNSVLVAVGTTLVSGLLGVSAALAARFSPNRGVRRVLAVACVVPVLTPELLIAVGSSAIFQRLGIDLSLATVVVGHTSFGVPLFFLIVDATLASGPIDDLIRAARDLGAGARAVVTRVALPLLWPTLVSTSVLIAALSVDDVVLSFFLSGSGDQVLTVRLYSLLRTKGLSAEISVACVVLMLLVVSMGFVEGRIRRTFGRGRL